jgi:hypothetical protein
VVPAEQSEASYSISSRKQLDRSNCHPNCRSLPVQAN